MFQTWLTDNGGQQQTPGGFQILSLTWAELGITSTRGAWVLSRGKGHRFEPCRAYKRKYLPRSVFRAHYQQPMQ
jgi:hypothetical protein